MLPGSRFSGGSSFSVVKKIICTILSRGSFFFFLQITRVTVNCTEVYSNGTQLPYSRMSALSVCFYKSLIVQAATRNTLFEALTIETWTAGSIFPIRIERDLNTT